MSVSQFALPILVSMCVLTAPKAGAAEMTAEVKKQRCLVLADGLHSEYAWGKYAEVQFPANHPGHTFCIRGMLDWDGRFTRWLSAWDVERIDLEQHEGALPLAGIDLVILDDVRQSVCDPFELTLVEFVRQGGALLVYAGQWGLGGCAKTEYCVAEEISSYQGSPLAAVLPVTILATPDLEQVEAAAVLNHAGLAAGIDPGSWPIRGIHVCEARGDVLAEAGGYPLVCEGSFGEGRFIVYTGDDLAWIRHNEFVYSVSPFAGTLWRRLAARAVGDAEGGIPAERDFMEPLQRTAAFAHPDQPMNFVWLGYVYYRCPEMLHAWAADMLEHSSTLAGCGDVPAEIGAAGVQGWVQFGCPIDTKAGRADESTRPIGPDGQPLAAGLPCLNNPQALAYMDEAVAAYASARAGDDWVHYGHMGDETDFGNCFCAHCRELFREQFGYDLPEVVPDFSPGYLDKWIDYCVFKNQAISRMYGRARKVARENKPGIKMFASLPQVGGMAHGDDQFHTQSEFDLLWDHTYPGSMVIQVGLNAALLEDTARAQGRPYVPVFDLLQGFDSYDRVPYVPPPQYVRAMTWQAIAHGVDSVGWFVYNAFWWNLPGSEAWGEAGRMARDVLEPLTPTLYRMTNAPEPVGLLACYSQEAVDGLKEITWSDDEPWKGVIRWWTTHATQEAYEALKYAHVPLNVVGEYSLWNLDDIPWKALVIPYVEHVHWRTRQALERYMARGGVVYLGGNSTLELAGTRKLPVSFDGRFKTWWPADRKEEWNQRRVRQYAIGTSLEKARRLTTEMTEYRSRSSLRIDDPEVVFNVRQAGAARYYFLINDHQINPVSVEMRKLRQRFNHFMLMPMEFPEAVTKVWFREVGWLYDFTRGPGKPTQVPADGLGMDVGLEGGGGHVFIILAERVEALRFESEPVRLADGVLVKVSVLSGSGVIAAGLPMRIELTAGGVMQTVYSTTEDGVMSWRVPFLKTFPPGPITVTVTDLASGHRTETATR